MTLRNGSWHGWAIAALTSALLTATAAWVAFGADAPTRADLDRKANTETVELQYQVLSRKLDEVLRRLERLEARP